METSLVFIHGFLGEPQDWDPIVNNLHAGVSSFHRINLNRDFSISELHFENWPDAFVRWLKTQNMKGPLCLVGYSMGGRLIKPLLEEGLAHKAVFLSSQFGFHEDQIQQRAERRKADQIWAEKFLKEPWVQVIQEWNAQDIFKNSTEVQREEKNFDRKKLEAFLTNFSLSEQKDHSNLWQRADLELLYLVGQNDPKYLRLAEEIRIKAINTKVCILKGSGHRLLLDSPQLVAQELSHFLKSTKA